MTEEQFKKGKALHERLEKLEEVKNIITSNEYHKSRLSYLFLYEDFCSDWEIVSNKTMSCISYILNRHDQQIRQEIDDEIAKLKKEIEAL